MMSPVLYVSGEYRLKIWSNPAFSTFPRLSVAMTMIIGMMPGIVMCIVCCQRLAPSISAASYRLWSMFDIAARYTIIPKPNPFHRSDSTTICRNMPASPMKKIGSTPSFCRKAFTIPSRPRISRSMPATVIHERKCGRYTSVWIPFFSPALHTSFNKSAITIGTIRPNMIFATAMTNVLMIA